MQPISKRETWYRTVVGRAQHRTAFLKSFFFLKKRKGAIYGVRLQIQLLTSSRKVQMCMAEDGKCKARGWRRIARKGKLRLTISDSLRYRSWTVEFFSFLGLHRRKQVAFTLCSLFVLPIGAL